jgi:hypothetical protein
MATSEDINLAIDTRSLLCFVLDRIEKAVRSVPASSALRKSDLA